MFFIILGCISTKYGRRGQQNMRNVVDMTRRQTMEESMRGELLERRCLGHKPAFHLPNAHGIYE